MTDNAVTKMERQEAHLPADPMVSMIERLVMDPNADLDKLERMLAMKERLEAQSARVAFARALSAARAEIPPIIKDGRVDYEHNGKRTRYQHETLAGIAKIIDPVLSQHGLSYRFRTEQGQGGVRVTCVITHADGHSEETSLSGAPDGSGSKNSFQAVGSAVTYLQRYTLKAALGLSAENDDDGQAAAPRHDAPARQEASKVSDDDRAADSMVSAIRKHGAAKVEADPKFQRDLAAIKGRAPEAAARVEFEIQRWHEANPPVRMGEIVGDDLPY